MDDLDEFYKTYGEGLASRLPEIAHSAARPAFVFVSDLSDPVEVMSFVSDKKIASEGPILIWDNFDEDIDTGGRDNYHSSLKCSMSILQKGLGSAGKAKAYASCRKILLKALAAMIQDAEEGELETMGIVLEVRQLPLEKMGPIATTWYGYGLQFSWLVSLDLTLSEGDLLAA